MNFEKYLKDILPRFEWIKDIEKQLSTVTGYDAASALLESLRSEDCFPMVLVEDLPEGNLSFEDGFLDNRVISFWVMERVDSTDKNKQKEALRRCFEHGKTIIKHIIHDGWENDFAATLDRKRTPYFPRESVGQYCYGYEFMLTFRVDIDMIA